MNITIKKLDGRTAFIYKGIRIDVDRYSIIDEPNAFGGKYSIKDASLKEATIFIDGEFKRGSVIDHFVIEQAMKELDEKSWGKSICPEVWK